MILSDLLSPRVDATWQLIRQCGVEQVTSLLDGGEQDQRMFQSVGAHGAGSTLRPTSGDRAPWSEASIAAHLELYADHGFGVVAVEDTPPLDLVRLGRAGRDEELEHVAVQIEAMGRLGIGILCYNWMALSSWARTDIARSARGGALVTAYRETDAAGRLAPDAPDVDDDELWQGLEYFLSTMVPVAERAGVRLAMHPDDPPRPRVRGVARIMSSVDAFRRLRQLDASSANAITFCQGNFALMDEDLPSLIEEFGPAIAFVHFRDVRGTATDFEETFHDDGPTDMAACMRAYARIGFSGPMRPDHVPTMFGESNAMPGYGTLGRLFALGYIRGLEQAAY
ncbi:mannonate dehydratase [uncultured Microbacterium sp.]|uniref:mannonate dehydratase n=1 Tax=uncultured Microbacterium sp. TaxID=191216 RepID=UPI0035C9C217